MNRTNLINYIIKKQGYKTYCEIGIGTGKNFDAINVHNMNKVGVDPAVSGDRRIYDGPSDTFFEFNKLTFDVFFIDGLHHADQVRKDIINAWECLNDGGALILHDTNPDREEITHVPRDSKEWCGDVYKAIYQVNNDKFTLKDDHGVTVIRKTGELIIDDTAIDWPEFNEFRNEILNLKTWEECVNLIEGWKATAT